MNPDEALAATSAVIQDVKKPIPTAEWEWLGYAAHLCVSNRCLFHLATRVGTFIVSTVGHYLPDAHSQPTSIGGGDSDLFETMVFRVNGVCTCGCGAPEHDGHELLTRRYATPKKANKGHLAVCRKVAEGGAPEVWRIGTQSRIFRD